MPRYDVHIQIVPEASYSGMKFYSFGQKRSLGVRGIQKLVNEYAKYLLTPIGTDPTDLSYGTEITNLIGSNVTAPDAKEVLLLSVDKATAAIQTYQSAALNVPDDERLASATVTDVITFPDGTGIAAQIFIQNVVGQGLPFLLPTLTPRT